MAERAPEVLKKKKKGGPKGKPLSDAELEMQAIMTGHKNAQKMLLETAPRMPVEKPPEIQSDDPPAPQINAKKVRYKWSPGGGLPNRTKRAAEPDALHGPVAAESTATEPISSPSVELEEIVRDRKRQEKLAEDYGKYSEGKERLREWQEFRAAQEGGMVIPHHRHRHQEMMHTNAEPENQDEQASASAAGGGGGEPGGGPKEGREGTEAPPGDGGEEAPGGGGTNGPEGPDAQGTQQEGTRAEWKERLRRTVAQFGQDVRGDIRAAGRGIKYVATNPMESLHKAFTGAERARAYAKYLTDRSIAQDERAVRLKTDLGKFVEGYNKLPFRYKAYVTAGLIGSSAIASAASLGSLSSILAAGMYGQRALGGAGFAINRRKGLDAKIALNPEHFAAHWSERSKNIYAGALGAAYMATTMYGGKLARESLANWLGHLFHHDTVVHAAGAGGAGHEASAPGAGSGAAAHGAGGAHAEASPTGTSTHTPGMEHTATPTHEAFATATATPETTSIPSNGIPPVPGMGNEMPNFYVGATHGRGYEDMAQRLWKELHAQHMTADQFPKGSDMNLLLGAKNHHDVLNIAHRIAEKHAFFNRGTGGSVRINMHDHLSVSTDGQLHLNTTGPHAAEYINAPEHAPTTGPYQPEAHHAHHVEKEFTEKEIWNMQHPDEPYPYDTPTTAEASHYAIHTHPSPSQEGLASPPEASADHVVPHSYLGGAHHDVEIIPGEPHIYADKGGEHLMVYGGSAAERLRFITEYFKDPDHAHQVLYTANSGGTTRIPWGVVNGEAQPIGTPPRVGGFLGFGKHDMPPPESTEFYKRVL